MSVSVSRSEGVTVMTLTSDPDSTCPPLCQLLGALCYSPGCCSGKRALTLHRPGAQTVLGALWIITGLLYLGLGAIVIASDFFGPSLYFSGFFPMWMGALSLIFGVCCVLAERHPRFILVLLSGLLNLTGVALSITTIVFSSMAIDGTRYRDPYWSCRGDRYYNYWDRPAPTLSPDRRVFQERCREAEDLKVALIASICGVLLTLSILDLCLSLSSAIISFKSLKNRNKPVQQQNKEKE